MKIMLNVKLHDPTSNNDERDDQSLYFIILLNCCREAEHLRDGTWPSEELVDYRGLLGEQRHRGSHPWLPSLGFFPHGASRALVKSKSLLYRSPQRIHHTQSSTEFPRL